MNEALQRQRVSAADAADVAQRDWHAQQDTAEPEAAGAAPEVCETLVLAKRTQKNKKFSRGSGHSLGGHTMVWGTR